MAAGRGQLSGQAQADTSRLHAIGFSPFAALSCALVLAGACLLDLPASAQVPSERPERGRAAPLEERSGRRGNRGPVEEFRTQVPSRPYDIVLGNPTETSVTASIVAYSTLEGYFEYGTDPGGYDKRSELVRLEPNVAVEAILDGLVPHAQHWYRWRSRASPRDDFEASGGFTFRSGRAQGETFVFTVQADSHLDGRTDTRLYEASLRNARLAGPDFHVDLGDTFMTDKRRTDYRDALPQYLAQ
ncbi:MAG: hypothetical protein F4173_16700, partial [Acidobacteriia bacterium]|nr:hypothetical protein [Terriglobia bacterium]